MFTHEAYGMAVIDHYERAVFVGEIAYALKVSDKAVHGENAVRRYELNAAIFSRFKLCAKVVHIVVLVAETLCLAETYAVDYACMVELV